MSDLCKVMLIGRLGADPELKYTPSGQAVANFSVATTNKWKDKDGAKQEKTEWSRCVAWGKTGEIIAKYLSKGSQCYVEGRLETRSWDDTKTGVKRYSTEIIVSQVQFLGGKGDANRGEPQQPSTGGGGSEPSDYEGRGSGPDDDIPFASADAAHEPDPRRAWSRWP